MVRRGRLVDEPGTLTDPIYLSSIQRSLDQAVKDNHVHVALGYALVLVQEYERQIQALENEAYCAKMRELDLTERLKKALAG